MTTTDRDVKTIGKHISNVFKDKELQRDATVANVKFHHVVPFQKQYLETYQKEKKEKVSIATLRSIGARRK